jgi:putative membrane-bound dehydrogenase-like protein
MSRRTTLAIALIMIVAGKAFVSRGGDPRDRLAPVRVPDGFTVEIVAAPPLVEHPLMAGFDDRGRLYVAESAGENLEAKELMEKNPNYIRRLEDVDGDGRFDRTTIFVDRMTMPMGALWHQGALYVASPPYIWRLEDTNDDGVADRREPIVGKFGFIGNAADIHGCFLGPNGRLYWCDGRHGHEFVDEQGRVRSKGKAARIFSCRMDGSDVQAHCGGGMDNPVEIDFTPEGEMLGTVNLFYQKRGDCLVHWMHGGAYPRYDQEAYIAEFKRTGDLLPPVIDLGHVAVSGMTRYRGAQWGEDFRNNVFVTQFNTHKVVRVTLQRDGSTFKASAADFWTSSDPDCHPTDVLQDADGSLLVIETGGWFRNGCPTSQVAKPQMLGAIYRIRRSDSPTVADPRGQAIAWPQLAPAEMSALLDDPRPAVAGKAISWLARHGESAVTALNEALTSTSSSVVARRHAIWALTRIETPSAKALVRTALGDADASVRQTAVASIGTTRDPEAVERLMELVVQDEPPIRREAATALGRIGDRKAVTALLDSARKEVDRLLDHATIYALIELNDSAGTLEGLADPHPNVRRSALVALDQMDSPALTRERVAGLLDTDDLRLRQAAVDVIARHPGWGGELVGHLRQWLSTPGESEAQLAAARGALLAFFNEASVQDLVAELLTDSQLGAPGRLAILSAMARADLEQLPSGWTPGLTLCLESSEPRIQIEALAVVARHPAEFIDALRRIVGEPTTCDDARQMAAIGLARSGQPLDEEVWRLLGSSMNAEQEPLRRLAAAEAIGAANLTDVQLEEVVALIADAGPLELPALVRAFERPTDVRRAESLLKALERAPGRSNLSAARIEQLFSRYPDGVRSAAAVLLKALHPDREAMQARLAMLEGQLTEGEPSRGRQVFFGAKAACSACHTIGSEGGQIGPDLTKIASIRNRRDLVEAVTFPGLSFARGFESYTVATNDGLIYNGVIRRETPEAIWLRTSDRAEVKLDRSRIAEMAPSSQSIMPEGLMNLLAPEERSDLVAFLLSLK